MKVYRLVKKEELKLFLEKDTDNLGGSFSRQNSNTFKYIPDVKYLHFFKKKADCRYAYDLHKKKAKNKEFYIATFDIPVKILINHIGIGYYNELNFDKKSGYEIYSNIYKKIEFAIPISVFNPDWLVEFEEFDKFIQQSNFKDYEFDK